MLVKNEHPIPIKMTPHMTSARCGSQIVGRGWKSPIAVTAHSRWQTPQIPAWKVWSAIGPGPGSARHKEGANPSRGASNARCPGCRRGGTQRLDVYHARPLEGGIFELQLARLRDLGAVPGIPEGIGHHPASAYPVIEAVVDVAMQP